MLIVQNIYIYVGCVRTGQLRPGDSKTLSGRVRTRSESSGLDVFVFHFSMTPFYMVEITLKFPKSY